MILQNQIKGFLTLIAFFITVIAFAQKNKTQNIEGTWTGKSSPDKYLFKGEKKFPLFF